VIRQDLDNVNFICFWKGITGKRGKFNVSLGLSSQIALLKFVDVITFSSWVEFLILGDFLGKLFGKV